MVGIQSLPWYVSFIFEFKDQKLGDPLGNDPIRSLPIPNKPVFFTSPNRLPMISPSKSRPRDLSWWKHHDQRILIQWAASCTIVAPCQLWQWLSVVSVGFQTMTYSMTISSGSSGFTSEIWIWDTQGYPSNTVKRSKPPSGSLQCPLPFAATSKRAKHATPLATSRCWRCLEDKGHLIIWCFLLKLCPN